jgi:hypothetical protein
VIIDEPAQGMLDRDGHILPHKEKHCRRMDQLSPFLYDVIFLMGDIVAGERIHAAPARERKYRNRPRESGIKNKEVRAISIHRQD